MSKSTKPKLNSSTSNAKSVTFTREQLIVHDAKNHFAGKQDGYREGYETASAHFCAQMKVLGLWDKFNAELMSLNQRVLAKV